MAVDWIRVGEMEDTHTPLETEMTGPVMIGWMTRGGEMKEREEL